MRQTTKTDEVYSMLAELRGSKDQFSANACRVLIYELNELINDLTDRQQELSDEHNK